MKMIKLIMAIGLATAFTTTAFMEPADAKFKVKCPAGREPIARGKACIPAQPIPEPAATFGLLACGALGMGLLQKRKIKVQDNIGSNGVNSDVVGK